MSDILDRNRFLNFAGAVEGGLALLALGLAWFIPLNPHPLERLAWSWQALGYGIAGAVPLFLLFVIVYWLPLASFRTIRNFLSDELAPSLAQLTWFDLILMALLAGFAEELLFRGVLEPWLGQFGSNVIFGLAHLVTPLYGVLTFVVGYYLSWLMTTSEPANLLTPIVTHAVHDYLAFLIIIWLHRREQKTREFNSLPHDGTA